MKTSLSNRYPGRWEVPLFIVGAMALLAAGLSLPLMDVQRMVFWKNEYSVFTGVVSLARQHEWLLAGVLFFFCLVFPIVKLLLLVVIWAIRLAEEDRQRVLHWLNVLGKWSMLDVFGVAILIVLVKLGPLAQVEPKIGVYFFAGAIAASMLVTMYVSHLARRVKR